MLTFIEFLGHQNDGRPFVVLACGLFSDASPVAEHKKKLLRSDTSVDTSCFFSLLV